MKQRSFCRGDIFLAKLCNGIGSEQNGTRPVVVLQNNIGNHYSPTLIVAPLTSRINKKKEQATHYIVNCPDLGKESMILCEQIITIDKKRIIEYLTTLDDNQIEKLNEHVKMSLGLIPINYTENRRILQ